MSPFAMVEICDSTVFTLIRSSVSGRARQSMYRPKHLAPTGANCPTDVLAFGVVPARRRAVGGAMRLRGLLDGAVGEADLKKRVLDARA